MGKKIKILVLIKPFWKYEYHRPKIDMIKALETYADVQYWNDNGHIREIIKEANFTPDFIFHYDIAWNYALAPQIDGLSDIDIPVGCFVIDLHWQPKERIRYIENNNIDAIFSVSKHPFLQTFPQYKEKLCWLPWSINPDIYRDWGHKKDVNFLLMGLVHVKLTKESKYNLPKKIPPKGRYAFRDAVFKKMKDEQGFVFHPHPGHRTDLKQLIVKEKYGKELNRAKMFFTCGSRDKSGGYAVLKFFEAPACKTLLLAEPNKEIEDLGFVDGVNYVACTVENVKEKALYYLNHERERKNITTSGYELIHQNHTNDHRAKQMIGEIKQYI